MPGELNPLEHVIYKLRNAKVETYPYPHFFVKDVFPTDFYWKLRKNLPKEEDYTGAIDHYENRKFAVAADEALAPFKTSYFAQQVLGVFHEWCLKRFPAGSGNFETEWRLVRDSKGYAIGPHTDAPWKVVSLLFYLPIDHSDPECGTSVFVPKDHQFTNVGGPHFSNEGFSKAFTAPYVPNSVFGFWKTDNSWHGVDEIQRKIQRDVLLYNIYEAGVRK